ncbi:MAG: Stp1/IreP family PP2C-type Ser/Thr phosphatase [Chloroflexi bacterium]|nr:Stp1/IreP family PP2C-type Ser/Thr phosphatase [Chloroflexota bacterium]MCC6895268.1 Stp1/IreP family PP2C-type Ser/Thr phosphatase [Anaerolineae bacterium]
MQKPEHGIRLRSSARTSTGQVRQNNEDNIHLWAGDGFVLAIIADGMGGAAAGEEASRIAVETIKAGFKPSDTDDTPITEQLQEAIHSANLNIVHKATHSPEMRGMGTTLTLAFVRGTYATFAHVGDSRAYLVEPDDETITQITIDHSYVQALVMAGHITPEQAETHSMGNVLYRALGQNEDVDVDIYYKRLHIGDRLILCSDGLTRHIKANELAKMAFADPNPDVVSQKMIDLANQRGGEDNISVIVIAVEGDPTAVSEDISSLNTPFAEDDRDATIILKSNPLKRSRETVEVESADPHDTLRLPKMKTEQWLDAQENGKSPSPINEADLLPDDPTEPVSPITDADIDTLKVATPSNGSHDGEGEGRDTLRPDQ